MTGKGPAMMKAKVHFFSNIKNKPSQKQVSKHEPGRVYDNKKSG